MVVEERTLLDFIKAGGPWGYLIILLALVGVALVVAYALIVRRGALLPPQLVSKLEQALNLGDVEGARELCARATALRNVLFAGLGRLDDDPTAAARAAHLAAEGERLALRRFIRWLLLTTILAVLVGALGTVSAYIETYSFLSVLKGSINPSDVWDSYCWALTTSYTGLLVAVVLFPAWWFFSARAAMLAHEIEIAAEDLISRVRNAPAREDRQAAGPLETT